MITELFKDKVKALKVIVVEADGVLTDAKASFDPLGNIVYKNFNLRDFEYINKLKRYFKFVVLSSDINVTYHVCRNKHIPLYTAQDNDKLKYINKIRDRYGPMVPDEMMYIGSMLSDIPCIRLITLSGCLKDAPVEIKQDCMFVLDTVGGDGAIKCLYDLLKNEINRRNQLTK